MPNTRLTMLSIARRGFCALPALLLASVAVADQSAQLLPHIAITSTVPANGDLNPYGVAVVPAGFPSGGPLAPGDVLVSNFNNMKNKQGTGTTIIQYRPNEQVAPSGQASVFFTSLSPGLTTALAHPIRDAGGQGTSLGVC